MWTIFLIAINKPNIRPISLLILKSKYSFLERRNLNNFMTSDSMSFSLDKFSMKVGSKHPSTTLRVTVRLSVVEVCFR
jgi:hypothetical protein